jgi:hypothetical protein
MKQQFVALISGILFGLGLGLSQMIDPTFRRFSLDIAHYKAQDAACSA